MWIFIDADAATRLWSAEVAKQRTAEPRRYSEVRASSLVYALRHERPALIIGPGGGTDVIAALDHGVPKVVGVEVNLVQLVLIRHEATGLDRIAKRELEYLRTKELK